MVYAAALQHSGAMKSGVPREPTCDEPHTTPPPAEPGVATTRVGGGGRRGGGARRPRRVARGRSRRAGLRPKARPGPLLQLERQAKVADLPVVLGARAVRVQLVRGGDEACPVSTGGKGGGGGCPQPGSAPAGHPLAGTFLHCPSVARALLLS